MTTWTRPKNAYSAAFVERSVSADGYTVTVEAEPAAIFGIGVSAWVRRHDSSGTGTLVSLRWWPAWWFLDTAGRVAMRTAARHLQRAQEHLGY